MFSSQLSSGLSQDPASRENSDTSSAAVISVLVTNTGNRTGTETVQYYLRRMAGIYSSPVRMLKGFRKVTLNPGESTRVDFVITQNDLAVYLPGEGWVCEKGTYRVYVGANAECEEYREFEWPISHE